MSYIAKKGITLFTPTGTWNENIIYTGNYLKFLNIVTIQIKLELTGTPNTATLAVDIPSGFTPNDKMINQGVIGTAIIRDNNVGMRICGPVIWNSPDSKLYIYSLTGATNELSLISQSVPQIWAINDILYLNATIVVNE